MEKWAIFSLAYATYIDSIPKTKRPESFLPCGDDRLSIVKDTYDAFAQTDSQLNPPEEVDIEEMGNEIDDYSVIKTINDNMDALSTKAGSKKNYLGLCLSDKIIDMKSYLNYKATKNDKYQEVAKTVNSYSDPEEKRKQSANEKKKEERATKKTALLLSASNKAGSENKE